MRTVFLLIVNGGHASRRAFARPLALPTLRSLGIRLPARGLRFVSRDLPLAFPGVVVGFLIILLAGRQGLIGDLTNRVFGEKLVFAYSIWGLFLGYLYFSIPRVILTIMAAVQKLDVRLEEAARSLGAGPWAGIVAVSSGSRSILGGVGPLTAMTYAPVAQ